MIILNALNDSRSKPTTALVRHACVHNVLQQLFTPLEYLQTHLVKYRIRRAQQSVCIGSRGQVNNLFGWHLLCAEKKKASCIAERDETFLRAASKKLHRGATAAKKFKRERGRASKQKFCINRCTPSHSDIFSYCLRTMRGCHWERTRREALRSWSCCANMNADHVSAPVARRRPSGDRSCEVRIRIRTAVRG